MSRLSLSGSLGLLTLAVLLVALATPPADAQGQGASPGDRDVAIVLVPGDEGQCKKLDVPRAEGWPGRVVRFQVFNFCTEGEVDVELRLPEAFEVRTPRGKGRSRTRQQISARVRSAASAGVYEYVVVVNGVEIDPEIEIRRGG
ncbi:MAG: hypothetical protein KJ066_06550 [Acidobacteria bacterium]|nr:hypothetical protein [Acidobacteriota bacterium]